MAATVRAYRAEDLAAVRDVCVRTGDGGDDARGRHVDDDLLPDVYAGPYLHLEPSLASVLADADRVVGYVLGTSDTAALVRRWREVWLPLVEGRHPPPADRPVTADEALVAALHHPERMLRPELAPYPAHLHIDLLPGYRGSGHGRVLMARFLAAAARAGAPAVHVGVDPANTPALRYYEGMGFRGIAVAGDDGTTYLGRATGDPPPDAR